MLPGITPALFAGGAGPLTSVNFLAVAGGGGGGANIGGGGGGGGVLPGTASVFQQSYSIVIGGGGPGLPNFTGGTGTSGGNTTGLGQTALGGGGGGGYAASQGGASGGCGGGGGNDGTASGPGGAGTAGQGFAGGVGFASGSGGTGWGGGGGGAGQVGGAARSGAGGIGGDGLSSSISGTATYYGGGGGGNGATGGGAGGGSSGDSVNGTNGLGGGGGPRANGGSGVFIISYPAPQRASGGVVTSVGGKIIHTFTANGTFTVTMGVLPDPTVKLLMHMDGANNAVIFPDSAYATPRGNATVSGAAKVSTAQSKFGGASAGFTGTGYLSWADHADFSFGAGDWTVDLWARVNTLGVQYALFGKNNAGLTNGYCLYVNASGTVQIAWLPSDAVFVGMQTGAILTDTNWHHYVVQRYGTAMQIYFDGVLAAQGSITASASIVANTNPLVIGQVGDLAAINLNGNIDEFRLVKGRAAFPGPFTPPTAPYVKGEMLGKKQSRGRADRCARST